MQTSVDMVQRNDPIVYVQDACYWVKHNPDKFKRLMHLCHREVDAGNPRVTRGDIYNLAREAGFTITECRELKRDNNKWPTLARYMVMLRPRLAKCLHFRESGIERDGIDLAAEWHAIVNPATFFYADDWKDAKAKCMSGDVTAL